MTIHPEHPDWVYVIPVDSDEFRCSCEGRLRVFRTRNAGQSWEALSRGLPQKNAFETVLRDAMTTDNCNPAGIYFGTRSGELFGSLDDGRTWQKILEGLPSVLCVRAGSTGHNAGAAHQAAAADAQPSSAPSAHSSRTQSSRSSKKRERP